MDSSAQEDIFMKNVAAATAAAMEDDEDGDEDEGEEVVSHPSTTDMDALWHDLQEVFGLGVGASPTLTTSHQVDAKTLLTVTPDSLSVLQRHPWLARQIFRFVEAKLVVDLNEVVAPEFWQHFTPAAGRPADFPLAVERLHGRYTCHLLPFARRLDKLSEDVGLQLAKVHGLYSFTERLHLRLKASLHSQLPAGHVDFERPIEQFYARAFQVFYVKQERQQDDPMPATPGASAAMDVSAGSVDEEVECSACQRETERCECQALVLQFHDVNRRLLQMDLLERLASNVLTRLVNSRIRRHVRDTCQGNFTVSQLHSLEQWLDTVVMGWIRLLYSSTTSSEASTAKALELFRLRLRNYLYETYTKTRIDQLFNILIEFPESQPALEDLKECLDKTNLRQYLTTTLKSVLETKLLHLGVNTIDILTAYIAAIRSLRVLDPSGVVLELVCESVRKYLRTREDTVRCIVQSLIDDNSSELADELKKSEGLLLDDDFGTTSVEAAAAAAEEDVDETTWEAWLPDPIDAEPTSKRSRRTSDIISMLVNIYGSKELFVNEYRTLLSNRLLSNFSYETEKEIRHLELLKLRFGETPLHHCEVMLKDIGDSKRLNGLLHSRDESALAPAADPAVARLKSQPFPVSSTILSAQFWPQFKQEASPLQLPPEAQHGLDVYTKAFEAMKGNRTLVWKTHLGSVPLELEVGEKKVSLSVSPVHAAIIWQFQVKVEWRAEELAHELKIPATLLRRRISFWQTQGLVREEAADKYVLVEDSSGDPSSGSGSGLASGSVDPSNTSHHHHGDEDGESVTRTSRDQMNEEMQIFWTYIVNMLINLESLPLERIFQMLKMFALQGPGASGGSGVDCDIDEVRTFLDKKVRERELVFSGGQYKLPKQ